MAGDMSLLEQAQAWIAQGIAVIPLSYRAKQPAGAALRYVGSVDAGGRATWEPYKTRLPELRELWPWFASRYRRNIGIVTGWQDLSVLDFDQINEWISWGLWATEQGGAALAAFDSYTVLTARGAHVYLRCQGVKAYSLAGVLDVKAGGGYVVGAGSVHPDGTIYRAIEASSPIVQIPSLRTVLPEGLLPPPTEQVRGHTPACPPRHTALDDPWEAAERAGCRLRSRTLIATAKRACQLEDLLGELVATGRGFYLTRCPLHDDQHPSLWVHPERGLCGCYAGCNGGRPMDVINLAAQLWGCEPGEAAQRLVLGER